MEAETLAGGLPPLHYCTTEDRLCYSIREAASAMVAQPQSLCSVQQFAHQGFFHSL